MASQRKKQHVSTTDLKKNLSRWLAKVDGGSTIVVTDRSIPVAKIEPLPEFVDKTTAKQLLERGIIPPVVKMPRDFFDLKDSRVDSAESESD